MKKNTITVIFLLLLLFISGCDNETADIGDEITLDNINIVCDVLPSGTYNAIRFTSPNISYTIANEGEIYKTEDGGNTWTPQDSGTEVKLYDLFFLNDSTGFVMGGNDSVNEGVILKTTSGGDIWESQSFPETITTIHFTNNTTGYAIGSRLYKTQNAGETWDEIDLGYYGYGDINFFDEQVGFLTTGNVILKTIDGGHNWNALDYTLGSSNVKRSQILNGIAYLFSNGSKIFKTSDRGSTWSTIDAIGANSIHFINERQAVAVGTWWPEQGFFPYGVLYITNDGGKSWEKELTKGIDEFYSLHHICFSNDSTALAVGATNRGCVIHLDF